jgi:hypothetical protein
LPGRAVILRESEDGPQRQVARTLSGRFAMDGAPGKAFPQLGAEAR